MRGKIALGGIVLVALLALAGFFILREELTVPNEQVESLLNGTVPTEEPESLQLPDRQQPPIPYCDLANHPEVYDGRAIRVTATLYFMMHGFKFMDRACLSDEKETAVIFSPGHESQIFNKLAKETGAASSDDFNPWSFPKIIATGRFNRVTPSRKSTSVADNSNLLFEIVEVEQVLGCETEPNDCSANANK
jgi:hypothetical protein